MTESKSITPTSSPAAGEWEGVGGYDYKGVQGNFGSEGLAHYFHYGPHVTVACKSKLTNCTL